jgi:preprotein translocase subunit SecD
MNRRAWNWLVILVVVFVAVLNPIYRHDKNLPIVTLGLDLRGGVEVLLQALPEADAAGNRPTPTDTQISGCIAVVSNRVDPGGTKEIYITRVGPDRLLLQVPGEKNPDRVISVIGETALLEFLNTANQSFPEGTDFNEEGTNKRKSEYAQYETILTGADLEKSFPTFDQQNKPAIGFTFKKQGTGDKKSAADIFGEFTTNHVGQHLTVLLDGKVLTSPNINGPIWGGDGIIQGSMDQQQVKDIVNQLNAGALPVPLTILQSSVVGPTLGESSIQQSFHAGLIGFAIVCVFMLIFYRLPGFVAVLTLALYIVVVLGYFSLINATLTLPGIAGFLLSIGMAIDGNIVIFERLKEELRWGKTLVAANEAAFNRAWVAIFDGNVSTLISAGVLFFFGTGAVKGFATTLVVGVLVSMFSAVFVTRNALDLVVRGVPNEKLYG